MKKYLRDIIWVFTILCFLISTEIDGWVGYWLGLISVILFVVSFPSKIKK